MKPIFLQRCAFAMGAIMLLLFTGSSMATVTITLNTANGPLFATSDGTLLDMGATVRVGFFNSFGANLNTLQTSNVYADVNNLFTPLAEGNTNAGVVSQTDGMGDSLIINGFDAAMGMMNMPGSTLGQITDIDAAYCTPDTALWIWVFNNADPLLATEWGIFTATTGWAFPFDNGGVILSTFEVDSVVRGSSTPSQLQLSGVGVIPEPGSLLLIIAAGVMLRRRRR